VLDALHRIVTSCQVLRLRYASLDDAAALVIEAGQTVKRRC
jgi:hypothetical protein